MKLVSYKLATLALCVASAAACRSTKSANSSGDASQGLAATEADDGKAGKGRKGLGLTANEQAWIDATGTEWRYSAKKMSWDEAQARCEQMAKQTKRRWRMPSPTELQEAQKRGISTSKNLAFGWVYLNHTWSAHWETTLGSKVAVYIDMKDGTALRTNVDHQLTTLCVRSDDPRKGDVWVDEQRGTVWRYAATEADWAAADRTCKMLARTDRLPWRMPTATELETAYKDGIQTPANTAFGREYLTLAWTTDMDITYGGDAYALDLRNGNRFLLNKEQRLHVICTRPINY